jgi:hypothetical protein
MPFVADGRERTAQPVSEPVGGLCSRRFSRTGLQQVIEPRLAPIRGVFLNDAALGCFIDCGNQKTNLICVRCGVRTAGVLLHSAKTRENAAIAKRPARRLSSTFSGGFRVGHF